jgi:hypothetical protein
MFFILRYSMTTKTIPYVFCLLLLLCGSGVLRAQGYYPPPPKPKHPYPINTIPQPGRDRKEAEKTPLTESLSYEEKTSATGRLLTVGLRNQTYDHYRRVHFGFALSVVAMDYRMTSSDKKIEGNVLNYTGSPYSFADVSWFNPGFGASALMDIRLNQACSFSMPVGPTFGSCVVNFWGTEDSSYRTMRLESVIIEMPLLLKYKARRHSNVRPYMIAGATPYVNISAFRNFNEEKGIYLGLEPYDVALNIGIGLDFYYTYFKLAIEGKYVLGMMNNISKKALPTYEKYPAVINNSILQSFVITIFIE